MARGLEESSREYEVHQLGWRVQRWPDFQEIDTAELVDHIPEAQREQDLSDFLAQRDQDDLSIDPLDYDSRRAPGGVRPAYVSDPVYERRESVRARDPNVVLTVAPYLRTPADEREENRYASAGGWRVRAAREAVLGSAERLETFRRDFLSRRPNAEMVREVEENRDGNPEPAWYADLRQGRTSPEQYREEHMVQLDGFVMDGPFDSLEEARDVAANLDGNTEIVSSKVSVQVQLDAVRLADEAEPAISASMAYVRADPALMSVMLGREGPSPVPLLEDRDDPVSKQVHGACYRLLAQHKEFCRLHPAESRAVEEQWTTERAKLRDRLVEADDPELAGSMLDAMDAIAEDQAQVFDRLRYEATVAFAVSRLAAPQQAGPGGRAPAPPADAKAQADYKAWVAELPESVAKELEADGPLLSSPSSPFRQPSPAGGAAGASSPRPAPIGREMAARLADEAYPDLHAGVALLDPSSPLAVRPAGAGAVYDREVRRAAEAAVAGSSRWEWGKRGLPADRAAAGPGDEERRAVTFQGWKLRKDVETTPAQLVAAVVGVEAAHERAGRLSPSLTSAAAPLECQAQRAAAAVVDTLSALESRGAEVGFGDVDAPEARLDPDRTTLVLPSSWASVPEDFEPLSSDIDVSDLDRLASGALELRLPGVDQTRQLYTEVGWAATRVVDPGETSFAGDKTLSVAREAAGSEVWRLDNRRMEHFAARMTDAAWGRASAVAGSTEPWRAPGQMRAQTEAVDDVLDRKAAVDQRVVTTLGARQGDQHYRIRSCAEMSVARVAEGVRRLPAAGLQVDSEPGFVRYEPDNRTLPVQRDRSAGPPADRINVPEAALDARQPATQLLDAHCRFYESVAAASGHPGRSERADAVTVARAIAGKPVSQERLDEAVSREKALVGACVRDRLGASWRRDLIEAAGVVDAPPVTSGHAQRFAHARRWSRAATTAPGDAPAQTVARGQPAPRPPARSAGPAPAAPSASRRAHVPPARGSSAAAGDAGPGRSGRPASSSPRRPFVPPARSVSASRPDRTPRAALPAAAPALPAPRSLPVWCCSCSGRSGGALVVPPCPCSTPWRRASGRVPATGCRARACGRPAAACSGSGYRGRPLAFRRAASPESAGRRGAAFRFLPGGKLWRTFRSRASRPAC